MQHSASSHEAQSWINNYQELFRLSSPESAVQIENDPAYSGSISGFSRWMEGSGENSLAIIGYEGTGASIALEKLRQFFGDSCTVETIASDRYAIAHDGLAGTIGEALGCGRSANMDDLLKYVNDSDKKVIFLNDCHNLFVRQVGGFNALYDLHHLLSFSRHKIFWVTLWSPFTWYFLNKTIGFNDFFDYKLRFQPLETSVIINWLQKCHDSTGFTLDCKTNVPSPHTQNVGWLPQNYISAIERGANGNIDTAAALWLATVKAIEEKHLQLAEPVLFNNTTTDDLAPEDWHILCSILFHNEISLEYLSEDMNLTLLETRMRIDRLRNREIIISTVNRTTFRIAPLALATALSTLSQRNLISLETANG